MFQTCVLDQKVQGKKHSYILEFFLNVVNRNIKLQNILDIINVSKFIQLGISIHQKILMKFLFNYGI
jgi:hypothetical protein